jgi:hypothetical protein
MLTRGGGGSGGATWSISTKYDFTEPSPSSSSSIPLARPRVAESACSYTGSVMSRYSGTETAFFSIRCTAITSTPTIFVRSHPLLTRVERLVHRQRERGRGLGGRRLVGLGCIEEGRVAFDLDESQLRHSLDDRLEEARGDLLGVGETHRWSRMKRV